MKIRLINGINVVSTMVRNLNRYINAAPATSQKDVRIPAGIRKFYDKTILFCRRHHFRQQQTLKYNPSQQGFCKPIS